MRNQMRAARADSFSLLMRFITSRAAANRITPPQPRRATPSLRCRSLHDPLAHLVVAILVVMFNCQMYQQVGRPFFDSFKLCPFDGELSDSFLTDVSAVDQIRIMRIVISPWMNAA